MTIISLEERRLRTLLDRIAGLADEAPLVDASAPLVDTPLPVAVGVDQGAALLGIAPTTLVELVRKGELRTFRVGRRRLVRLEALSEFARALEAREAGE